MRDAKKRFICWATDAARKGFDREKMAAKAQAMAREVKRQKRAEAKQLIRNIRPERLNDEILSEDLDPRYNVVSFNPRQVDHGSAGLDEAERAVRGDADGVDRDERQAKRQAEFLAVAAKHLKI